jgi:hypothetical protein
MFDLATKEGRKASDSIMWLGFAVIAATIYWLSNCSGPLPAPAATPQIATVNPEVSHEKQHEVPLSTPKRTFKAYSEKAKAQLVLPASVLADPTEHVTSSSILSSSERRQVLSTVLDATTGETTAYVTTAPDPWLSFENRGQLSVDYGFKRGSTQPVGRVNGRYDLLQTKALHWGVSGSLYTDGDYFVGIGGSYRW